MLRRCILALIFVCAPALSQAFDCTNWYLRGFTGFNFLSFPSLPEAHMYAKTGYAIGGSLGYRLPRNLRLEGELVYRHNTLSKLCIDVQGTNIDLGLRGYISSFAYMGNLLFDFPVDWAFVPYLGAGLGGYREWGKASIPELDGTDYMHRFKYKDDGVAYQVIAGLSMIRCNKINAGIEYRFFDSISHSESIGNHTLAFTCRRSF